jgi:hypothetical protein
MNDYGLVVFPYQIGAVVRAKRAPAAELFCTKSTSSTNNGISPQNGEFIEKKYILSMSNMW